MKTLKAEKEQLQHFIEGQKKVLSAIRREQKELQTAVSNIDAILGGEPACKKGKQRAEPVL